MLPRSHPSVLRGRVALGLALVLLAAACGGPDSADVSPSPTPPAVNETPSDAPRDAVTSPSPAASTPGADRADPAIFAYDASDPLRPDVGRSRQSDGVVVERLTYRGDAGERVPALFAAPVERDGPLACVIVVHGFRGTKESFPIWELLGRGGYAAFAIDARFHGERRDAEMLRRIETDPTELARLLRETVIDLRRGIDYLETREECDPERIGYIGASMGGFIGSLLAGADERVQAPVLLVSGADWRTMLDSTEAQRFVAEASPEDIARAARALDPLDPRHWIARVSPRPVLMVAGDQDRAVPPSSARALHEAAAEPKQVVWYHGGHSFPSGPEMERVLQAIVLWLSAHLGA